MSLQPGVHHTCSADCRERHWIVTKLDRSRDAYYRFHVQGWNAFTNEPFSWSVPSVTDSRQYDLGGAR